MYMIYLLNLFHSE